MNTENSTKIALSPVSEINDTLTEVLRQGAKDMLAMAINMEVQEFLNQHDKVRDEQSHRLVVRNGYLPERTVQTGVGNISVQVPRVRDNSGQAIKFNSRLLPPYLKRTKSVEELLPWLYLKGISTGQFSDALFALLGQDASLSANTISRLKTRWEQDYAAWRQRDLSELQIVYLWADGVYLAARLAEKQCILVLIGADATGKKHVLGLHDGFRESTQSWHELLTDLKSRGLTMAPQIAVGDGALGFWGALSRDFPETQHQRCWVHKTMNVLNKLPKTLHPQAKTDLHAIWMAETQANAEKAFDVFMNKYEAKYFKATDCLAKDRNALLTFYNFPSQHWHHLRTTNPIESLFSTVKLRTAKTRGCLSRTTAFAMLYKLVVTAEKRWPKLREAALVSKVIQGVQFKDGKEVLEHAA